MDNNSSASRVGIGVPRCVRRSSRQRAFQASLAAAIDSVSCSETPARSGVPGEATLIGAGRKEVEAIYRISTDPSPRLSRSTDLSPKTNRITHLEAKVAADMVLLRTCQYLSSTEDQ